MRPENRCSRALRPLVLCLLGAAATASAEPIAYVANAGTKRVTLFDAATRLAVGTVPLVGSLDPHLVVLNAAGTRLYVTRDQSNQVAVIDTATRTVLTTITSGTNVFGVAENAAGTRLYLTDPFASTLTVLDAGTHAVITTTAIGASDSDLPQHLAVNPAGTRIYVANSGGSVTVVDAANNQVATTVAVNVSAYALAVSPDGSRVFVSTGEGNGAIAVIDAASNTVVGNVPLGSFAFNLALSPDGATLYAATSGLAPALRVIDTCCSVLRQSVPLPNAYGVAVDPSGSHVYVSGRSQPSVYVVDSATLAVVGTVAVGPAGDTVMGIAIGATPAANVLHADGFEDAVVAAAR